MKIMCLNGWGGKLHSALLPFLATAAPDILCLQEVVHSPASEKDWLEYRDGSHVLRQRANFFSDLCSALPEHQAFFCPSAQGVLWDNDLEIPSQWGLATFVHRSLPVIGQTQSFVHKDFSPAGYGDHPRSRTAHGVRVYDDAGKRAISVSHMHGLRHPEGKFDTPDRAAQAQRLLALSRQVSGPDELQVICGDFNVEPDSETLRILAAEGFTELVTSQGFIGTRTSQYPKSGKYADYMLVNDRHAVKAFDVIRTPEVSDHCPLLLEI